MVLENTKTLIGRINTLRIIRVFDGIRSIDSLLSAERLSAERYDTDPV